MTMTGSARRVDLARLLLGRPMRTEEEVHERLGKPTALAVFASDNLSSSAYATEEILHVLVPVIGVGAFALVVPLSLAMVGVLALLVLSYRQTIKEYPTAGGAYIVTRDNFGLLPAQVAGTALLTDYVLTVSVSVAAGVAALTSAFAGLIHYRVPISLAFIALLTYGNLRGVRESGKVFAVPTYFFIATMAALLVVGLVRLVSGDLPEFSPNQPGLLPLGSEGQGLLVGASLFKVLHAFSSGGTAVTGVEAISNGVPAFRAPEWKHARTTLVVMASLLGVMFLGLSVLAAHMHVVPFADGSPTVISEVGRLVFGSGPVGWTLYYCLQVGTMLILVLAANTSFADFPRLASFHAQDHFLPSPLTRRGRRLVFSNGIIVLAVFSALLVVAFQAEVHHLIPLYAIGVFGSFTFSQAGMARRHLRLKNPGWRHGLLVNGLGALTSAIVLVVFAVTKFTHGAWIVLLFVPAMVAVLVRINRHYAYVEERLGERPGPPADQRRRLTIIVFVAQLDESLERAMRYVAGADADDVQAVHLGTPKSSLASAFEVRYAIPLLFEPKQGGVPASARRFMRALRAQHPDRFVAAIVPELIETPGWVHMARHNHAFRLKAGLLLEAGVSVINVPTIPAEDTLLQRPARRHVVLVPVASLHTGTIEALKFAELLRPLDIRAVHFQDEEEETERLLRQWEEMGLEIPVEVVAAPYRDIDQPLVQHVRDLRADGADLVTVVIGELVLRWWQNLLHNHRALEIKAALLFEPGVAVASVPHRL
jgi:amino acid transporter